VCLLCVSAVWLCEPRGRWCGLYAVPVCVFVDGVCCMQCLCVCLQTVCVVCSACVFVDGVCCMHYLCVCADGVCCIQCLCVCLLVYPRFSEYAVIIPNCT